MRRNGLVLLLGLVSLGLAVVLTEKQAGSMQRSGSGNVALAKRDWSVDAEKSLLMSAPPRRDVEKLVVGLLGDDLDPPRVGEYEFRDLNRDGKYELLVTLDSTGRGFYNGFIVVSVAGAEFKTQNFDAFNVRMPDVAQDLDGDGITELIVPRLWSAYEGSKGGALWTTVYAWNGQNFGEASHLFPELYERRIEILENRIDEVRNSEYASEDLRDEDLSNYYVELHKAYRFLKRDPRAGVDLAVRWAQSGNASLSRKAIRVLEDVGDSEAIERLLSLSQHPDLIVSTEARHALTRLRQK
jgi:hypothetical protein